MRAAVLQNWQLRCDDLPQPTPAAGQILTRVLACGICGSDLHLLKHGERQQALTNELEADLLPDPTRPKRMDPTKPVVMGHEFCCEVLDIGPGVTHTRPGDLVVSMPGAFDADGVYALGFSNQYPGGYAEFMVLNDDLALKVPNGLTPRLAALTEPLAVGIHAVARSRIGAGESAVVLGCGPVGLAVIVALKLQGIGPIVATDLSSTRRSLAEQFGADVVIDPRVTPPVDAWRSAAGSKPVVIFEAVGVPGMLDAAMRLAPRDARIVVVGACMEPDQINPIIGISRELDIQFVLAYTPEEFGHSLHVIANGDVDIAPLITGTTTIDGIPDAFADLAHPERHAKILVEPHG